MKPSFGRLLNPLARLSACLLIACGLASANAIIVATGVDWSRGSDIWLNGQGQNFDAYFAGVFQISLTEDGITVNRDTVCVDLFTDIFIGQQYSSNVLSPDEMGSEALRLERAAWLLDNVLQPTEAPPPGQTYTSSLPSADWVHDSITGAALQLAIWDIVHDNGDGFSSGLVQLSTDPNHPTDPNVLAWAQFYEALSLGQLSNSAFVYLNADLGNGQPAQSLLGPIYHDNGPQPPPFLGSPNPEPSTFVLGGMVIGAVGFLRLRSRKAQRTMLN